MELYPKAKVFNSFNLKVSELHSIFVEESGNQNGKPVIFLHGGPGGGISSTYRQYFNPEKWRIIMFDQRGCGKSTPFAELNENTTWDLVNDIEKIRNHLNIDQWVVFGGSWGSTLSLAYSQKHPNACKGLILRGIFLVRKKEIDWFYQYGASNVFPDRWESFLAPIPESKRNNLLSAYYEILTGDDQEKKIEAAKAWSTWEGSSVRLILDDEFISDFGDAKFAAMGGAWLGTKGISIALAIGFILAGSYSIAQKLRGKLIDLYVASNYEFIIPPLLELSESIGGEAHDEISSYAFSFLDDLTGKNLSIRPDISEQASRIDAYRIASKDVVRLCYAGDVVKKRNSKVLRSRTTIQVGAEIFGDSSIKSDLESINLMIKSLLEVGLKDITLSLGHAGFTAAVMSLFKDLDNSLFSQLEDALMRKSKSDLSNILPSDHKNLHFIMGFTFMSDD